MSFLGQDPLDSSSFEAGEILYPLVPCAQRRRDWEGWSRLGGDIFLGGAPGRDMESAGGFLNINGMVGDGMVHGDDGIRQFNCGEEG